MNITIFFNNGEIYHGSILIPGSGWVTSVDSFIHYIGDRKFIKDENNYTYPISSIFKMKDMVNKK